jgi:hypothetical protein
MNPSICRTLSTICFQAGMLSILLSIWIWWFLNGDAPEEQAHAERFGIFIGLWAPTLLILSNRFDRYADKAKELPGLKDDDQKDASPDQPAGDHIGSRPRRLDKLLMQAPCRPAATHPPPAAVPSPASPA